MDNARLRLLVMVENMRQLAAAGHAAFQQHLRDGHDDLYLRDIAYLETNRAILIGGEPPPILAASHEPMIPIPEPMGRPLKVHGQSTGAP